MIIIVMKNSNDVVRDRWYTLDVNIGALHQFSHHVSESECLMTNIGAITTFSTVGKVSLTQRKQ